VVETQSAELGVAAAHTHAPHAHVGGELGHGGLAPQLIPAQAAAGAAQFGTLLIHDARLLTLTCFMIKAVIPGSRLPGRRLGNAAASCTACRFTACCAACWQPTGSETLPSPHPSA
jgi:hypothetical protein